MLPKFEYRGQNSLTSQNLSAVRYWLGELVSVCLSDCFRSPACLNFNGDLSWSKVLVNSWPYLLVIVLWRIHSRASFHLGPRRFVFLAIVGEGS